MHFPILSGLWRTSLEGYRWQITTAQISE